MYLVSKADRYMTLFSNKASRCISTKALVLIFLKVAGTSSDAIASYAADNSGVSLTPLPGSRVEPEHRIIYLQMKTAQKHLSGTGLAFMTELFFSDLTRQFLEGQIESGWVEKPCLYAYLQDKVFRTAVNALCGFYLLSQSSTFVRDFWQYVADVTTLVKRLFR